MRKNAAYWELFLTLGAALLGAVGCGSSGDTPPATLSVEQLMDPETCRECHAQHYTEWSGSMHAYASQDPLFVALNQRAQDVGNVGSLCATCHAPLAVRSGATKDGTDLASSPRAYKASPATPATTSKR